MTDPNWAELTIQEDHLVRTGDHHRRESMTDQQDAVERVLDKYVYEVVGREGHGTEWHCHECLEWSNQSRASVDHDDDCPVGLLEAQRSRLETCQQENERLALASEILVDQVFELRALLDADGPYSINRSDGDSMGLPEGIYVGERLDLIDCAVGNVVAALDD